MLLSGLASKKRHSRSPFDESQTEYVKIPSAVKRPCVLTDRQKEVLARQKAGEQSLPACDFYTFVNEPSYGICNEPA